MSMLFWFCCVRIYVSQIVEITMYNCVCVWGCYVCVCVLILVVALMFLLCLFTCVVPAHVHVIVGLCLFDLCLPNVRLLAR